MPITYQPIPTTFDAALDRLYQGLDDSEKTFMRATTSASAHFGLGMFLRNEWNLWGTRAGIPTDLRADFIRRFGLGHADDMSGILLSALWAKVMGEPFDYPAAVQTYRDHWINLGVDPITQEEIP